MFRITKISKAELMGDHRFSELSFYVLLFPLALVLFEFSTYIANDMILPAMLLVIRDFGGTTADIPTALSAYIIGGASLPWLLGPLSDQVGRRPVMMVGVVCFILACVGMYFVNSLDQFFVLRVIQGMGMGYVTSVGYATIHDKFTDKAAVKVTSLMANVALISPMVGPLAGVFVMHFAPWQVIFLVIAVIAGISCFGLYKTMPETHKKAENKPEKFSIAKIGRDYGSVFTTKAFLFGAFCAGFSYIPLVIWLGDSPTILMKSAGLSSTAYAFWQIPIFAGLIIGNILVACLINYRSVRWMILASCFPLVSGILLSLVSVIFFHAGFEWIIIGFSLNALGLGLSSGAVVRLTLISGSVPKGTISAAFGMVTGLVMTFFLELVGYGYAWGGASLFVIIAGVSVILFLLTLQGFLKYAPMADDESQAA